MPQPLLDGQQIPLPLHWQSEVQPSLHQMHIIPSPKFGGHTPGLVWGFGSSQVCSGGSIPGGYWQMLKPQDEFGQHFCWSGHSQSDPQELVSSQVTVASDEGQLPGFGAGSERYEAIN